MKPATLSLLGLEKEVRLWSHVYYFNPRHSVFPLQVPSGPPTSVITGTITPNAVTVHWGEVACLDRNGDITGYTARASSNGRVGGRVEVTGNAREATITGLTPSTEYLVQVAAVNSAGTGPYSSFVFFQTKGKHS